MSSFFSSIDVVNKRLDPAYNEMNDITAINVYAIADQSIKALIPPPLQLADPALLIIYVSNINQPTFAKPYMEGGIGVMTTFTDNAGATTSGLYYFSLQLVGPGAENAIFIGRESWGFPKKIAHSISLTREGDTACFHVERNGVKLLDGKLEIGSYNDPAVSSGLENLDTSKGLMQEGGVLTHRYIDDSFNGVRNMGIYYYDSPTFYYHYEPAFAAVKLQSTEYDPWGEIKIAKVLGGSWSKNDNFAVGCRKIYAYLDAEAPSIMQYLFAGRFDPLVGKRTDFTSFVVQ